MARVELGQVYLQERFYDRDARKPDSTRLFAVVSEDEKEVLTLLNLIDGKTVQYSRHFMEGGLTIDFNVVTKWTLLPNAG